MNRLGTAAQNGGVAGLQAQAGGVDGHVRPRLIDDADHTQRHAHLANLDTRRQVTHIANLANRVRQGSNLAQSFDHRVDHRRGQRQTVNHGRFQTTGTSSGQVQFIGGHQFIAACIQRGGGGLQGTVFLRGTGARKHARSAAGGLSQAGHIVEHGLSHDFGKSGG